MDNNKVKENVNRILMNEIGITYEDYIHLDIYKQQEIMKYIRSKRPKIDEDKELIMIGYGEYSLVTRIKKGTKVMTRYGNMVEVGLTPEEEQERFKKREEKVLEEKTKKKVLGIFRRKI